MYQRIVKHPATRAAAVLMLAGGGVLLTAGGAAAAPAITPSASAPVSYSCDLSTLGQGMGTLPVSATLSAPATVSTATSVTVTLVTSVTQIPSATASQLPQISSLGLSGTSQFTGASGGSVGKTGLASLTGQSSALNYGAGQLSELPSLTATGTVIPKAAGGWTVAAPHSFQLLPKGTTTMTPVTCTVVNAVTVQVNVMSASAATTGTSATQTYTCTVTAGSTTMGTSQLPFRLGYTGQGVTGMPESVSLSSTPGAMNSSSAFTGTKWASAAPMASSASLGLSGAYGGSIPLSWSASPASSGQFALAGQWLPKTAGKFHLHAPHQFTVKTQQQTTTVTVACVATTATTPSTTVTVATASTTSQAAGTATGSAAAPNTGAGGSLHPATDIALAVAGGVVLLGGAGLMVLALRRRGHSAI